MGEERLTGQKVETCKITNYKKNTCPSIFKDMISSTKCIILLLLMIILKNINALAIPKHNHFTKKLNSYSNI